ncbi:MAG: hypothetical protein HY744_19890 [Deltaproteobacteria bacterium]|nr:hypothetical protein [Deltaproteobacteria bacterium]
MLQRLTRLTNRLARRWQTLVPAAVLVGGLGAGAAHVVSGCAARVEDEARSEVMNAVIEARVNEAFDRIAATETQRQRIRPIVAGLVEEAKKVHKGVKGTRQDLTQQWLADKPDADAVHKLVDHRADELRQLAHKAVDAAIEVHGLLDAGQRRKIAELAEERRHLRHQRWLEEHEHAPDE